MSISVIITAFKEERTIGKAIKACGDQLEKGDQLIVSAPDAPTLAVARSYCRRYPQLEVFQDQGKGKPAALNAVLTHVKHPLMVLTDGDVFVSPKALHALVAPFADPLIGAVTGRPRSLNPYTSRLGYWSQILTRVADEMRYEGAQKQKPLMCSGYLFAIRTSLFPALPTELLSEDGYISLKVLQQKKRIGYARKAEVFVRYPTSFSDWILQKKRSAGGYNQIRSLEHTTLRSFTWESRGAWRILRYPRTIQQWKWTIDLFLSRLYLWGLIYRDITFRKQRRVTLWKRVETTK